MPTLETRIRTDRAHRYLTQFCRHAAAMAGGHDHHPPMRLHTEHSWPKFRVSAEWAESHGVVSFSPWGVSTLDADDDQLTIHIAADTNEHLHDIREIITADLTRFSTRDPLTVHWEPSEAAQASSASAVHQPRGHRPTSRRSFRYSLAFGAVIVAMLAAHLVLGGAAVASIRWTGAAIMAVVALVVLKLAVIWWGGRKGLRHIHAGRK